MKKIFVQIILVFTLTACKGGSAGQVDPHAVETVVAGTLNAIPSATDTPEPTATIVEPTVTFTPEPTTLLPRSLYYLASAVDGNPQIFRLERDGITVSQITDVDNGVIGFDVSPADGSLAFIAKSRLFVSDPNGQNRNPVVNVKDSELLAFPHWSPDGKMIVYKFEKDLFAYSINTGKSEILHVADKQEDISPLSFSPDGGKLLLIKDRRPESRVFIYDFASGSLIPIQWVNPADNQSPFSPYPCFGFITWSTTDKFFCHFNFLAGAVAPGLWRVNADDGSYEELLWSSTSPFTIVGAPYQNVNGTLYYLYGEEDGVFSEENGFVSLTLMSSDSDGKTNRAIVRPETFHFLHGLWTPDGKAVVVVQDNGTNNFPANMLLVPLDSSQPVITLVADASALRDHYYDLRWGN